jgi:methylmalonyl-CoA mutase
MAGVAIDSIYDMRRLTGSRWCMSVSMTVNGAVLPVLALVVAAESRASRTTS